MITKNYVLFLVCLINSFYGTCGARIESKPKQKADFERVAKKYEEREKKRLEVEKQLNFALRYEMSKDFTSCFGCNPQTKVPAFAALSSSSFIFYFSRMRAQKTEDNKDILHYFSGVENFQREWIVADYLFTPYELEESIDRIVKIILQPKYIKQLMSLIEDRAIKYNTIEHWRVLMPLEDMIVEDEFVFNYFLYYMEKMALLRKGNYHIALMMQELSYDRYTAMVYANKKKHMDEILSDIRNSIKRYNNAAMIPALMQVAIAYEIGLLTDEARAYVDQSSKQINLKWIPLVLTTVTQGKECFICDYDLNPKQKAQMLLAEIMGNIVNSLAQPIVSYEQYKEHVEIIEKQIRNAQVLLEEDCPCEA